MDISIAVVTYNEEANISICLNALCSLQYKDAFEIIIVDGCSTDKTKEIVLSFQSKYKNIKLINNNGRTIASNRYKAVEEASYNFIAFTDADCIVSPDWLTKLATGYDKAKTLCTNTAGVGGANIAPKENSLFLESLDLMLNSYLGSFGSVQGKRYNTIKKVNNIPCANALFSIAAIKEIGSFDVTLGNMGEDADLCNRLRHKGYSIYFIPDVAVIHKLRPNLKSWSKNMYDYGKGRAKLIKKDLSNLEMVYILPILFVVSFLMTPLSLFHPIFLLPLLYFPIIIIYSLIICIQVNKVILLPIVLLNFIATHFHYAAGEIIGLIKNP